MSRKIAIIGMGNVGAAVAHGLIAQGAFDDYVFIEKFSQGRIALNLIPKRLHLVLHFLRWHLT